jgi:hypothetical protein
MKHTFMAAFSWSNKLIGPAREPVTQPRVHLRVGRYKSVIRQSLDGEAHQTNDARFENPAPLRIGMGLRETPGRKRGIFRPTIAVNPAPIAINIPMRIKNGENQE